MGVCVTFQDGQASLDADNERSVVAESVPYGFPLLQCSFLDLVWLDRVSGCLTFAGCAMLRFLRCIF